MSQVGDGTALFSADYAQARQAFLQAATMRGLAVEGHLTNLPGAMGEELATDVVLDGPAAAERLLVVISGVHGAEGYCGSALQTGFLLGGLDGSLPRPPNVAVLHVHAINPHGFSFGRRVTQENVDLNRNFVDFQRPLPDNPGYDQLHAHLLPATWPPPIEAEQAIADYAARHGARGLQQAITLGQHTQPEGMFYRGRAPTWSQRCLRDILRRHAAGARQLASIDIHTGLGPCGVGERIFASFHPDMFEVACRWWGELTSVNTGSSTSVPMQGPVQVALHEECPAARHAGICLEFGTVPLEAMLMALRGDHWLHSRRVPVSQALAAALRQDLRAAFYPESRDWKSQVWRQGAQAYRQALQGLDAWTAA